MTTWSNKLLLWSPRVLGVLLCLFLSLFALDAFDEGKTFLEALPGFLIHVSPMIALLAVVAVSWRWEWVGGVVFVTLAFVYAYWARHHLSWIAGISVPLLVVGVLFLLSWAHHSKLRASG